LFVGGQEVEVRGIEAFCGQTSAKNNRFIRIVVMIEASYFADSAIKNVME
jgi:hypothetical protein